MKEEKKRKQRLFEILDDMNQYDIENKTQLVAIGCNFISADKVSRGAKISMGAEFHHITSIANGKTLAVLLLIDAAEYNKRSAVKKNFEDRL